jgi:hypothetical protein
MPTLAPTPRPRYHYATLTPRMLAPLSSITDFAQGGDARKPLHTFSAHWSDACEDSEHSQDIIYEFVYEGECGITWPLRKIRVDNRALDESEEENGDALSDVYDVDYEAGTGEEDESGTCPTSHPMQYASTQTRDVPTRLRIRICRPTHEEEIAQVPVQRFKVRVPAPGELGNESMRRLPRRRGALVLQPVQDVEVRDDRIMYGALLRRAATAPCDMASEVRKDSGGCVG